MAPPSEKGHVVLFHYGDFGPPSMAHELLGPEWWSWERGGSFEPCDEFDVRVAVYDRRAADEAKRRYPTVRDEGDYRLVERNQALRFLDEKIAELAPGPTDPGEYDFGPLRRDLERTRQTLLGCLTE